MQFDFAGKSVVVTGGSRGIGDNTLYFLSTFPSPPAERGKKDAQGWRGAAEPYPELVEEGAAARKMPKDMSTDLSEPLTLTHPRNARPRRAAVRGRRCLAKPTQPS
jgi:hypothetical protein